VQWSYGVQKWEVVAVSLSQGKREPNLLLTKDHRLLARGIKIISTPRAALLTECGLYRRSISPVVSAMFIEKYDGLWLLSDSSKISLLRHRAVGLLATARLLMRPYNGRNSLG